MRIDMAMPKCCKECPLSMYGRVQCQLFYTIEGFSREIDREIMRANLADKRPIWCPLEEEPEDDWIPAAKRLPEVSGTCYASDDVLVTVQYSNGHKNIMIAEYRADNLDRLTDGEWDGTDEGCYNLPVIAWRPLPEPYKGGTEYDM